MGRISLSITKKRVYAVSEATGFYPAYLEKVIRLLGLLEAVNRHPAIKSKVALIGGTALNLFIFNIPRMSIDIDLNYLSDSKEEMLAERPSFEQALRNVCRQEGLSIDRFPNRYSGGKSQMTYTNVEGRADTLELDINYLNRVPLWGMTHRKSYSLDIWQARGISVLDIHELAAGKWAAMLERCAVRDMFDAVSLSKMEGLDEHKLRLAFLVYCASMKYRDVRRIVPTYQDGSTMSPWRMSMKYRDVRRIVPDDVTINLNKLHHNLMPTLANTHVPKGKEREFGFLLVDECKKIAETLLSFTDNEIAFLDLILDRGMVDASLLTADKDVQARIQSFPPLAWRCQKAKRNRADRS